MAAAMKSRSGDRAAPSARAALDRWVYVYICALLVVLTLAGFVPSSIEQIAAVRAGERRPFTPLLHMHAVLMGAWLVLLLAQAGFVAAGRRDLHHKLGALSFGLVPALVGVGFMLAQATFQERWALVASGALDAAATLRLEMRATGVLLNQLRILLVFPALIALALWVRRSDAELHKRLMILGTIVPVQVGIERMAEQYGWPTTLPESPLSLDLQMLLPLVPLVAYELVRYRRLHRAYAIWLGVFLPPTIVFYVLLGTPWWRAMAPKLMGVA